MEKTLLKVIEGNQTKYIHIPGILTKSLNSLKTSVLFQLLFQYNSIKIDIQVPEGAYPADFLMHKRHQKAHK